jgi:hypothetical protein
MERFTEPEFYRRAAAAVVAVPGPVLLASALHQKRKESAMAAKKGNASGNASGNVSATPSATPSRSPAERAAPAKPAPKKASSKAAAPTPQKTPTSPSFDSNARANISQEELRRLISEAAYYRAKQRGFAPGHELEDWIAAEAEVIGRLNSPGGAP